MRNINNDKLEVINICTWKSNQRFNIYALYNPPTNKPNLDILNVDRKTVIIGDFNCPSKLCGYSTSTPPGEILEEFLSTTNLELIYKPTDTPTFLHYNDSGTNLDLLLVSSGIADKTTREIKEDPGRGIV